MDEGTYLLRAAEKADADPDVRWRPVAAWLRTTARQLPGHADAQAVAHAILAVSVEREVAAAGRRIAVAGAVSEYEATGVAEQAVVQFDLHVHEGVDL